MITNVHGFDLHQHMETHFKPFPYVLFDTMLYLDTHEQLQKYRTTKTASLRNECSFPSLPDISEQDEAVLLQ